MSDVIMRKGLRRSISYRLHVKIMYVVACLTTLVTMGFAANTIISVLTNKNGSDLFLPFVVLCGITFSLFFMGLYLFHRLAFTHFVVEPESLKICRGSRVETLDYKNIERIELHDIPFALNMFVLTLKNGRRHFFTMAIERSEYILESIYSFESGLFQENKLRNYRISAIVADHWAHRAEKRWRNLPTLLLKFILVPSLGVGAVLLSHRFGAQKVNMTTLGSQILLLVALLWVLAVSLNFALDVYLVALENKKLEKDPNDLKTDMKYEAKLEIQNRNLYLTLALLLTFIFAIVSR